MKLLWTHRSWITEQSPIEDKITFLFAGARRLDPLERIILRRPTVSAPGCVRYVDGAVRGRINCFFQGPCPARETNRRKYRKCDNDPANVPFGPNPLGSFGF